MTANQIGLHVARKIAKSLIQTIKDKTVAISIVGSTRRWNPMVGGIDLLAAVPAAVRAQEALKREFAALGDHTVRGDSVDVQFPVNGSGKLIRAILHLCSERNWGAALLYHTGNTDHNRCVAKNLQLCADLLLHPNTGVRTRTGEPTRFRTEHEIYQAANMPFFPPECREHNAIPPDLFAPEKYQSDFCVRSDHGGGEASIGACIHHALANGITTIAISDRLDMVSDPRAYLSAVEAAKQAYPSLRIYAALDMPVGIDGYMRMVPTTKRIDFLSISLYREPTTNPEMRILTALDLDPRVKIVHGAPISVSKEWKHVYMEMARRGVALGISPDPDVEVPIDALRAARANGVKFVLCSGAYDPSHIGRVVYAQKRARRALLTNQDFAWSIK